MAGPSQPQVTDEVWDDDRIKSFLDLKAVGDNSEDFHILLRAYRGMRPADFARFLPFFQQSGRNLDAKDKQGRTLWDIASTHRQGADFINIRSNLG